MSGGGKGGSVTVGYRYFLGMHMALCHGPIDKILEVQVDGRVAWTGTSTGGSITVDAPDLFGGDKREGGVSGVVDFEFGEPLQGANSYLTSVLPGENPAYRGVACAVLNQCYMGNNPYLKPWSFTAQRIYVTEGGVEQWHVTKSVVVKNNEAECLQFGCSSYVDYLQESGATPVMTYLPTTEEWEFPFTSIDPIKAYVFFTAGPTNLEDWSDVANKADTSSWTATENSRILFCDGEVLQGVITEPPETGDKAFVGSGAWGDGGFSTILSGHNNVSVINGEIFRGPGKRYRINVGSGNFYVPLATVGLYATEGGAHELRLFINGGQNGNQITNTPVGVISNKWNLLSCYISSAGPRVVRVGDKEIFVDTINIIARINGVSASLSHGYRSGQYNLSDDLSISSTDQNLYSQRRFFYQSQLSFLSATEFSNEIDLVELENQFLRNSQNYQTPDTCCPDMNPAHIIRECLTESWGLGYQAADIDSVSFLAAANALYNEGMGMSILWDREVPIEDFISEILRHIDGVLYVSRTTGKFVLKLIRNDYDEASLITLDETNARMASDARRPTIGELVTSVTVEFTDVDQDEETGSVTLHNEALIQLQGAVNNATAQYPGFMTRSIASRVAQRDLRSLSTPLLSCDIEAGRVAADLNIGDAFKLNFPEQGIYDLVMRVESMSVGDGRDNTVKISCVEDAFSVPDFDTVGDTGPGWVDPVDGVPEESEPRLMIESPYYELVQQVGDREAGLILDDDPGAGFLFANGGRQGAELNADFMVDGGGGYVDSGILDFAPYATLALDAWYSDSKLYYTNGKDLDTLTFPALAQVGEEIVRVDSLGVDSNGAYMSVGRGVLDTVPSELSVDSAVVFFTPATDNVQYTASDSVNVKLLTALGSQRLADAPADTVTFDSRAIRPYPPGNLEIDFESYPRTLEWDGMHSLSWAHRDRLLQTSGTIFDYTDGDIGPESGTSYVVTGVAYTGDAEKPALRIGGAYQWAEGDVELDLGTDDFCIEFSIYFDDLIDEDDRWWIMGQQDLAEPFETVDFAWRITYRYNPFTGTAQLLFQYSVNGQGVTTATINMEKRFKPKEWHDVRIVCQSSGPSRIMRGYINGIRNLANTSVTNLAIHPSSQPLRIGNIGDSGYESWDNPIGGTPNDRPWSGYVSNVRITVGDSRLDYPFQPTYELEFPFPEIPCDSSGVTPCDEYFDSVVTLNRFNGTADNDVIPGNTWTLEGASMGVAPASTAELVPVTFLDVNVGTATEYDIDYGSDQIGSGYTGPPDDTVYVELSVKSVRDGYDSWQAPMVTLTVPPEIDSIGFDSAGFDSQPDSAPSDPYFANVSLLLHMDGADGSTTFTDSSNDARVIANGSSLVEIRNTQSKFGGTSAYYNVSGNFLTPAADAGLLDLTENFTIEFWCYQTSAGSVLRAYAHYATSASNSGLNIYRNASNGFLNVDNGATATTPGDIVIPLNEWVHIAVVRDGATIRGFVNGFQCLANPVQTYVVPDVLLIGNFRNNLYPYAGYLDDFRITKGIARYTAAFTPPTAPFPDE